MEAVIAVAVAKLTVNSGIGWTGLNLIETARRETLVRLWVRVLDYAAGADMRDVRGGRAAPRRGRLDWVTARWQPPSRATPAVGRAARSPCAAR